MKTRAVGRPDLHLVLAVRPGYFPCTIDAVRCLAKRGVGSYAAERAMAIVLKRQPALIYLPMVDDEPALVAELAASGVAARR